MIKVSANKRFFVHDDGSPFFYLGDTAWELFHRCTHAEAVLYLQDRAAKHFSVIQAVVLAEYDGVLGPNALGDVPFVDNDPMRPNSAYFEHVDAVVREAASLGLVIGMLPTWGDKWNKKWGIGPEIFTPANAFSFGAFLGDRYRNDPLIWILGGDRPVETEEQRAVLQGMAAGLRAGDGGTHLITFHPTGSHTSAEHFHDEPWLDFNMWQSGHARNRDTYNCITADYERTPIKPCLDAEPGYEDHPASFNLDNGYLDDYDVRKSAYWALFAGACGHTYGCHPVWQMCQPGRPAYTHVRRSWQDGLRLPGAGHMRHVRALLESRPFLTRIPDQGLILSDPGAGTHHVRATRDQAGSFALVYIPSGQSVTMDLSRLSAATLAVHWYDPRMGTARSSGEIANNGPHEFVPPPVGPDWVLVLDDVTVRFPVPGTAPYMGQHE